ncbi:hypothetical protein J2S54_001897 [Streptomyces sp. DSM 42143]|nr:hypothetical protein [Streptomyces sp. DSM 42143]
MTAGGDRADETVPAKVGVPGEHSAGKRTGPARGGAARR